MTGILDFGDFGHNWRVAEPAILLLYVMLLARPFEAAIHTLVRSLLGLYYYRSNYERCWPYN